MTTMKVVFVILLGFQLSSGEELKSVCPNGYAHHENSCYKILGEPTGISWIEAIHECHKENGILAEPTDFETTEFLRELAKLHHELLEQNEWFIGLTDLFIERDWIIPSSGRQPNFTIWDEQSPDLDDLNTKDCAVMVYEEPEVFWKDVSCTDYKGNYSFPVLPVCQKARCPDGSVTFGRHCYYLERTGMTWDDAETNCAFYGGHLASIHSKEENDFIQSLTVSGYTWIGGKMTGSSSNSFQWTDGSVTDFNNWDNGQPNDGRGAEIYMYSDGTWFDNSVSAELYSVCKI